VAQFERHGTTRRIVVVDGSSRGESRVKNVNIVNHCGSTHRIDVEYWDAADADVLIDELADVGCSPDELRHWVRPGSPGASRNLSLLLTAGEHIAFIDDDVISSPCALTRRWNNGITLDHIDAFNTGHFTTRHAARDAMSPADVNIFDMHERTLGRTITELASSESISIARNCQEFAAALSAPDDSTVMLTCAGIVGDLGMSCADPILFSTGKIRTLLVNDRARYDVAMSSREGYRVAAKHCITHESFCMTYSMGLVNTSAVPPFVPLGRGQDTVFGEMLALCDGHAMYSHLPVAVTHDSDRRPNYDAPMGSATGIGVAEVILAFLSMWRQSLLVDGREARIMQVGRLCQDAVMVSPDQFNRILKNLILARRTRDMSRVETAAAADAVVSPHWRDGIAAYRRLLNERICGTDFFRPFEFSQRRNPNWVDLQAFVADYGNLLIWWPRLWQAARQRNNDYAQARR
jgi:hypothetical protein